MSFEVPDFTELVPSSVTVNYIFEDAVPRGINFPKRISILSNHVIEIKAKTREEADANFDLIKEQLPLQKGVNTIFHYSIKVEEEGEEEQREDYYEKNVIEARHPTLDHHAVMELKDGVIYLRATSIPFARYCYDTYVKN
jgi:hypothetical protein